MAEKLSFDMKFNDLMKEVNVTVNLTDWRGFYFRARIAKVLIWLAFKLFGSNIEFIE